MKENETDKAGKDTEQGGGHTVGAYGPSASRPVSAAAQLVSQPAAAPPKPIDLWAEESKHWREKPWMKSTQGRFAIRIFSRGVMGSLLFAMGGRLADQALHGYDKARRAGDAQHYARYNRWYHKGIRGATRFVDTVVGKPIEKMFGTGAVTFRDTRKFGNQLGRSVGHEFMDVTFNFACASVGDGMGRSIANLLDPNVEIEWLKGGKLNLPKMAKNLFWDAWRWFTYSAGEDFAVAAFYIYFMKAQRAFINKVSPGWKYDFDFGMNGTSFKTSAKEGEGGKIITNDDGSPSLRKGSYFWEGAFDLQSRFTAYNIGTLMFREIYQDVASRLKRWKNSGFEGSPFVSENPDGPKGVYQRFQQSVRYAINATARGILMMTPTVPFFWMFRIPQGRFRALAIDQKTHRPLEHDIANIADMGSSSFARVNDFNKILSSKQYQEIQIYRREGGELKPVPHDPFADTLDRNGIGHHFDPYPKGQRGIVAGLTNAFGRWSNKVAAAVTTRIEPQDEGFLHSFSQYTRDITRTHVHSAFAYTPYFMIKTEWAELWGTTVMKRAVDRVLDGMEHFDGREFKAGLRDCWRAFMRRGDPGEVGYGSEFSERKSSEQVRELSFRPASGRLPENLYNKAEERPQLTGEPADGWQVKERDRSGNAALQPAFAI